MTPRRIARNALSRSGLLTNHVLYTDSGSDLYRDTIPLRSEVVIPRPWLLEERCRTAARRAPSMSSDYTKDFGRLAP